MNQPAQKTSQQIVEFIIRFMVKQGKPCIRFNEGTKKWEAVNFNMQGDMSALFCMLKPNLSLLKKRFGYEFLQSLSNDLIYWHCRSLHSRARITELTKEGDGLSYSDVINVEQYWQNHADSILERKCSYTDKEKIQSLTEEFTNLGLSLSKIAMVCLMDDCHVRWGNRRIEEIDEGVPDEESSYLGYTTEISIDIVSEFFKDSSRKSPWDDEYVKDLTVFNPYP